MATDPAGEIGPRRVQGPPTVAAGAVRPARGPASVSRPAAPRPPPMLEVAMEAIIERAAGLDVHQGSVVACVIRMPRICLRRTRCSTNVAFLGWVLVQD